MWRSFLFPTRTVGTLKKKKGSLWVKENDTPEVKTSLLVSCTYWIFPTMSSNLSCRTCTTSKLNKNKVFLKIWYCIDSWRNIMLKTHTDVIKYISELYSIGTLTTSHFVSGLCCVALEIIFWACLALFYFYCWSVFTIKQDNSGCIRCLHHSDE